MAKRLKFNWIPFVKYSLILLVYVFAGGLLIFFLEECKNDQIKPEKKTQAYAGNMTSLCMALASKMNDISNRSSEVKDIQRNAFQDRTFIDECINVIIKDEIIIKREVIKCSWQWKNIRKWVKFVYASLTTLGYQDFQIGTQVGKGFVTAYLIIGVPFSVMCFIHFGSIIRVFTRRMIRKIEAHFFNRREPRNIRHKVIFYNMIMISLLTLTSSLVLASKGADSWTYVDCLYYATSAMTTIGNEHMKMDSEFFIMNTELSVLLDILQVLCLGLISSLIQAGTEFHHAKHKRMRLPLRQQSNGPPSGKAQTNNDVINGTVAMDSLVILVRDNDHQETFT